MTSNEAVRRTSQPAGTLIWDPLVRSGHWALVAAFAVAFFSPEEEAGGPGAWHVWSGYVVGGIVLLRVRTAHVGQRLVPLRDRSPIPAKTEIPLWVSTDDRISSVTRTVLPTRRQD